MIGYLIVAIELAFLYAIYWCTFVHRPKPYKIIGDPWGIYGRGNGSQKNDNGSCPSAPNGWVIEKRHPTKLESGLAKINAIYKWFAK